jgi:lysophospholipase L1-like esterase
MVLMACIAVGSFLLGTLLTSPSRSSLLGGSVYGTPSSPILSSLSSSSSTLPPTVPTKRHQVLVYGDFLTSGVSGTSGNKLFPYAKYLEQALHQQTNGIRVSIHQVGLPSWTTTGMLKGLDGSKAGLRANIKKHTDPTVSLVILLAGTNDVLQKKPPTAPDLEQNLQKLHQVCLDAGVPRTLAIGIPAAIVFHSKHTTLVTKVNSALQQHFSTSTSTTFVPFPLDSTSATTGSAAAGTTPHQGYWHANGMHLTESGYQRLGESLAPIVQHIIQEMDQPAGQDEPDGQDGEGDDGKQDDEGDDGRNEEGDGAESDP